MSGAGGRAQTRSPRRAVGSWRLADDLALRAAFAEAPPASEAQASVGGPPWLGFPRLPAAGDNIGFLRWRALTGELPPDSEFAWKWTAADRDEARDDMLCLFHRPQPMAASARRIAGGAVESSCEAEADEAAESAPSSVSSSEEEFEGAHNEKEGVRDEEARRWPNVVAQMQKFWSEAAAEATRLQSLWEAAKQKEDVTRRADARKIYLLTFRAVGAAAPNDPFAEHTDFCREEAACDRAAAKERARWRLRAQLKFEEAAELLLQDDAHPRAPPRLTPE